MYEGLSSPNIHTPKNLSEYATVILHYPTSSLWAGGTFIMSRPDSYPSRKMNAEIIYLGDIEELHRFQRNDRFAEFGAMVTLDEILSTGKAVLPGALIENIQTIGSRLITRRATIGGTIATKDFTTSFPGTLIALDATAEIRFIKKKRLHSRWLQITRLLDKSGRIVLPSQGMISRVRIAFIEKNCQYFKEVGSFMLDPENSVAAAFTAMLDQDILINPKIAFTYPTHGVCYSRDIDNIFSSLRFPVYDEELNTLESMIFTFIESSFQDISPLQKTRTRGLLYEIIDALNEETLTIPTEER